ncbi:hypothetical protein D3C87_546160 [compost metagenome]
MFDYETTESFLLRAEEISNSNTKQDAFEIITNELLIIENKYLNECLNGLTFLQYENCLEWIEENISRTENITLSWGHLAGISKFNWKIAEKWIDSGRPLSLVSLDAINFCTTKGERLNQSPMMRKINPKIIENPNLEIIAKKITEYQLKDNSPRVKRVVKSILKSLFD